MSIRTTKWLSIATVAIAFWALFAIANAQDQPAKADKDARLADELEDDLLRDLPGAKKPSTSKGAVPDKKTADKKLLDQLEEGEDIGAPPENPLERISKRMRAVEERIGERDTSDATQSLQKEILSDLAKLIEQTKKQCNGGSGKSGPGKASAQAGPGTGEAKAGPAREATERVGKANREETESADVKDVLRRVWGHLPEKLRDQMQAQLSEQFLPKYEKLIEEYYKRLAEERQ